jgi:hypothetical protein
VRVRATMQWEEVQGKRREVGLTGPGGNRFETRFGINQWVWMKLTVLFCDVQGGAMSPLITGMWNKCFGSKFGGRERDLRLKGLTCFSAWD